MAEMSIYKKIKEIIVKDGQLPALNAPPKMVYRSTFLVVL